MDLHSLRSTIYFCWATRLEKVVNLDICDRCSPLIQNPPPDSLHLHMRGLAYHRPWSWSDYLRHISPCSPTTLQMDSKLRPLNDYHSVI